MRIRREREREKKTQVELKVFLNLLKTPHLCLLKYCISWLMSWFCQVGHTTHVPPVVNGICQYHILKKWHASNPTKFEGSSHKKLRKLRAQPKQIVSISSSNQPISHTITDIHMYCSCTTTLLASTISLASSLKRLRNIINLTNAGKIRASRGGKWKEWNLAQCAMPQMETNPEDWTFAAFGFFPG